MTAEPVLVVDDNAVNLKLVRVILVREGYDVRTAGDAEEALRMLETFTPRLILMDIQLPGIDGLTLTRQLKQDPARKDIVILALSAYAMKGDEDKALAAGCDGYITKPIDPLDLPRTIASYLNAG
jgi:CheY-like chemotaxis protein